MKLNDIDLWPEMTLITILQYPDGAINAKYFVNHRMNIIRLVSYISHSMGITLQH